MLIQKYCQTGTYLVFTYSDFYLLELFYNFLSRIEPTAKPISV